MRSVVFDMDGVIFDSERLVIECWETIAAKYGIPDVAEACLSCIGTTYQATRERFLERYGRDFPYDAYKKECTALFFEKAGSGQLPMKPGVLEVLDFIRDSGGRMALASSTRSTYVIPELRDAGILEYFDEVVCGDMVQHSKPDPEIFLLACRRIGSDPAQTFAVEDSRNGIRAAFTGGLRPIMVPDLLPPDDEMREKAERILPDLSAVRKYLQEQWM